jgi:transposase
MILGTSRAVRVFAYPEAVDLRKGYDGLFGLLKQGLQRDPLGADPFLFVNKRSRRMQGSRLGRHGPVYLPEAS